MVVLGRIYSPNQYSIVAVDGTPVSPMVHLSHPVLEGKPNVNHVRARISNSRTQQLYNWTSSHSAQIMTLKKV
jgi:hypothetical protein